MESDSNWQMKALINELTQGMELTKQLRGHLNSTSSAEYREILLRRILSSYEKALLILKWDKPVGQPQLLLPITRVPESPVSGDGSPQSEDFDRGFKDHQDQICVSRKRKMLPTWTDQVKIYSENGLEGPTDDGYSWRKYGQKDILGTKYPRSYYRCTYRSTQNCWATKQVQRSDDDPTVLEIIYRGRHNCNLAHHKAPTPTSPSKPNNHPNDHQKQPPSQNMLFQYRTSLKVNTEDLDSRGTENPSFAFSTLVNDDTYRSFSPSFVSPATSETNYFSTPPCQTNIKSFGLVHNLPHSESELNEIISGNTSATNSSIVDLHSFSIDPSDPDPSFPFDTAGFFS